jgi:DNA polymerase I-like protein with 3'-5' exonuclease and polymerase domains
VSKFKGAHQQYSTNEEVLTSLIDQHPLPAIVLEHRHVSKMLSGFVVPLCESAVRAAQRDGLSSIFTRWSQTSTATGRLSSSEPNLQNVPKQESVRFGNRTDMTKEINAHILRSRLSSGFIS